MSSVGVVIASIIIYMWPKAVMADPLCTFVFSFGVLVASYNNIKDVLKIIMEGAPRSLKSGFIEKFKHRLLTLPNVVEIHDFHIWNMNVGKPLMSAHIVTSKPFETLKAATILCRQIGIFHSTIQVEPPPPQSDEESAPFLSCRHNIHV
jgi:cation diffusion facilitator family transporter